VTLKKAAKTTMTDLERATADYNHLSTATEATYQKLYDIQDSSLILISDVEQLVESISHNPLSVPTAKLKKLKAQKETFQTREVLEREKRKDELAAGVGAVAVLGAGVAATLSFGDILLEYAGKKLGSKFSKNIILSAIILLILLIPAVIYAIGAMRAQKKAAKTAAKNTAKVRKAIEALQKKQAQTEALYNKTVDTHEILSQYYHSLACYTGALQKDIPKEHRSDLITMLNYALSLAALLNEKLD